ncbi:hypothetical protein MCOR27_003483 [Pyricularia oryzae]|uniref:chitinase n=1 Tax=Pyricularia grisea TaxID=148305 RepID=A0ABQ8NSS1_PYRGI|nr:hypothetical protein MCOR01_005358 [Pyricularia oryzae]KAI6301609.1 hypothetical protein MCOR33_002888 [Pyricularia grisea]KAH9427743.1 hypothetical protein MCOR02_011975 [Pyricularia oryzae]KAI6263269.1 hypothetical protein MCOR19_000595 [Pyricularia oryzae]KAI6282974.1 hypothetical protein MCOR27_003483 [Pyricularia oryzae]
MFTKWKRDKDQYPSQPTQASFPMPAPGTSGYPSSYQYGYNNNTAAPPPIPPRPYNLSPAVPPYPSAANPNMSAGGMSRQYINAVYYPNWRIYKQLPPSKLQVNNITHVFYAFIGVNKDGTLKHFDEYADLQIEADGVTGCLAAVRKLKHQNPHLKTIVSLGGGSGSAEFPALATNPRARDTLARATRQFVDQHGFDGVDIDWEQPSNTNEGEAYVALLTALRQALPAPRYLLTTALPCGEWALQHIPLGRAAALLDMLNLMSYDFSGPWAKVSAHHAQLRHPQPARLPPQADGCLRLSAMQAVSYMIVHGVHPGQIVLGVPAYARFFRGARALGAGFSEAGEVDYNDLPTPDLDRAMVDPELCAAWYLCEGEGGKGFVSLDTPATVRLKAGYVRANGLAGLFYWQGVGDVSEGPKSLVAAGMEGLRGFGG